MTKTEVVRRIVDDDVEVVVCDVCGEESKEVFRGKTRVFAQGWWSIQKTTWPSEGQTDVDLCPACAGALVDRKVRDAARR